MVEEGGETAFVRGRVTVLSRFRGSEIKHPAAIEKRSGKEMFVTCTACGVQRGDLGSSPLSSRASNRQNSLRACGKSAYSD